MILWNHWEHLCWEFIQRQLLGHLFLRLNWEHLVVKQWIQNYTHISQKVKSEDSSHVIWCLYRINIYFEFLDSEQSVIFIGIIVGLSFVAVLLASISLILIKKSKNKKSHLTHFEKSNSFQANIYTQNTFCKVRLHSKFTKKSKNPYLEPFLGWVLKIQNTKSEPYVNIGKTQKIQNTKKNTIQSTTKWEPGIAEPGFWIQFFW